MKRPLFRWKLLPSLAAALGAALLASSCSTLGYALDQGFTLLGYLRRAIPLERLEEDGGDSETARKNREFAALVRDIRRYAGEELGLAETKNYRRFVEIDRDWLALVVSASSSDSFTPHIWNYPVVGRMPYKGFFRAEDARAEAARLRERGLDVWVREVDAFSTLGWFRDPLYSYMRDYPVHRLANLLLHELAHATVYIKNQSQFDEEFAEFTGTEGARRYLESRCGAESAEYRAMMTEEADRAAFAARVRELRAELETLYASGLPREETLSRKAEIIAAFQARFGAEYDDHFQSPHYRGFAELSVNNAFLDLYRLYYGEDDFFGELYRNSGSALPVFIAAAKRLRKNGRDPRAALARLLLGAESAAPP